MILCWGDENKNKKTLNDSKTSALEFKLAHLLDGKVFLRDQIVQGARISINEKNPKLSATESIIISGKLSKLDYEAWQPYFKVDPTNKRQ